MSETGTAVVYARLSKDSAKDAAGVTRQLEDARKLAQMRGLRVIAEYTDNDVSAAGGKRRPGFSEMLATITNGERPDVLIAWSWDRLSRNRRDTLQLIEVGQEHRLTIALVRGSDMDMTSAAGRLVADMLAGMARAEVDQKGERQTRAARQRAEQGRPPSRRAFGYQQDGTPHPSEASVVAETFALFLAGSTMAGLAKRLNAEGHTTARGHRWHDTGVRVMLTNARYAARRVYRGEHVAVGKWQPLVSDETFEAVQAKLRDSSPARRRPARRHLGSSLFRCYCGATVKISYDGDRRRIYKCSSRSHMTRAADPVDEYVRMVVVERLRREDIASLAATSGGEGERLAGLRLEAVALRLRSDSIASDYADGLLTARQVAVATQRVQTKLLEVENELAALGQRSALASIAEAPDLGEAWLALPLDRQQAVLRAMADIVIQPGRRGRSKSFDTETIAVAWRTE